MSGLGLDDFLGHGEKKGGGKSYLSNWKKEGKIIVWLSTRSRIAYPVWSHPFFVNDVKKNEDGDEVEFLRFVKFVSPEPDEKVHKEQFFREPDGRLQNPPHLDPFLRLREWLRYECDESLDAVVFQWNDPKDGRVIKWTRGELSRLKERGQNNYNHSLDSKLEYLFVVVENEDPGKGPQIARTTKLLGDSMKDLIRDEMESNGREEGNPQINPYAIRWKYDKNESPMKMYKASRFNQAKLTSAIEDQINSDDFPDPTQDTKPKSGDKARIRAAMEDAAVMDIPWSKIFSRHWDDDVQPDDTFNPEEFEDKPSRPHEVREEPKESKPVGRTRKRKDPEPEPEPEPKPEPSEEVIPCDECGYEMKASESKCPKCGAEYEIEEDEPQTSQESAPGNQSCFACESTDIADGRCQNCGLDVDDDLSMG